MAYASLAACVADLEQHGQLRRIDVEVDARLELAAIQRGPLPPARRPCSSPG